MAETTPTPLPEPNTGGSYVRDPVTGELARQQPEPQNPALAPADEGAPA